MEKTFQVRKYYIHSYEWTNTWLHGMAGMAEAKEASFNQLWWNSTTYKMSQTVVPAQPGHPDRPVGLIATEYC